VAESGRKSPTANAPRRYNPLCVADPPFNVPIDGHVCGLGAIKHREFAMASGEMSRTQFAAFLETALKNMAQISVEGALLYICMDWRHVQELLAAGEAAGLALKNICVRVKPNGGLGSLYRSQHEFVCVFKSGKAAHINNIEPGKHGRYRTNLWGHSGANSFRKGRMSDTRAHDRAELQNSLRSMTRDVILMRMKRFHTASGRS
jgi:hypothetical protein